jgi:hypothetical protein
VKFLCLPFTAWDSVLPLGPLISVFTIIRSRREIYRIIIKKIMSCNAHPIATYQCTNSNNKTKQFSKTPPPPPPFFTHTNGFLMEK